MLWSETSYTNMDPPRESTCSASLPKRAKKFYAKYMMDPVAITRCQGPLTTVSRTSKHVQIRFLLANGFAGAKDLVCRCLSCQFFGKQAHVPMHKLTTIPPSWQFACWNLDMIGPLTIVLGGFTLVLVVVDKFTNWIEYKPITKITADRVVDFICDILHRFGFPNTTIIDLGSNFTSKSFLELCEDSAIDKKYV